MRGKKAADFGDVHPAQQVRVAGGIRTTVRRRAGDVQVNGAHLVDQPVGVLCGAVGGAGQKLPGTPQPAEHVLAKTGMVPDTRQRQRMQRLQHQRADAADQHAGEVAMHLPAHRLRAKQTRIAFGVLQVQLTEGQAGEADDLGFDAGTDEFHVGLMQRGR